jgi:ribosomal protein S18 acetylase RimI-like enzyme
LATVPVLPPIQADRQTMSVTIRRARPDDELVLAELNAFVHDLHVGGSPAYFKPTIPPDVASWFRGLFDQPNVRIWIAEEGGVAVGYVIALLRERTESVFTRARRWLEIDQIGVRPGHRRTGIGRALVQVVLEAGDNGIHDIELSTWVFNGGAQEASRRLGFTPQVVRFGRESSRPAAADLGR